MAMIKERISALESNISLICEKLGRNPQDIILVGVTKFASKERVEEAISCGLHHLGENKVQEAQKKYPSLRDADPAVVCHMIGHLQTNKVKAALEVFDIIESVNSIKLAQEISRQAVQLDRAVDILVQVNTSGEEQKYGFPKSEALASIEQIAELNSVHIKGLMTIAPLTEDKPAVHNCFRELKKLFDQAQAKFANHTSIEMRHLSMGMTNDYEIALEEGANMLRIGSAIFKD